jgi:hypothetical protein
MLKFYSLKQLTQHLVEQHQKGSPLNPSGCRGFATIFTYGDTDKQYVGRDALHGNRIIASSAPEFVCAVNNALDAGHDVVAVSAQSNGARLTVSVKLLQKTEVKNATKGIKAEDTQVLVSTEESGTAADASTDSAANQMAEGIEGSLLETGSQQPSEVQVEAEVDAPLKSPESEPCEVGEANVSEVDWNYAESIIKRKGMKIMKAKKELEAYALKFGINLDRGEKFENMIIEFKGKVASND